MTYPERGKPLLDAKIGLHDPKHIDWMEPNAMRKSFICDIFHRKRNFFWQIKESDGDILIITTAA